MKKKQSVFIFVLIIWLILSSAIIVPLIFKFINLFSAENTYSLAVKIIIVIMLSVNALIFCFFWLKSTKNMVFSLVFLFGRKKLAQKFEPIINSELTDEFKNKKVVLLYCTCDDFHEESLSKSMVQYWNNYETVILDDSKSNEYIEKVNEFANKHNLKVVRRENKEGFKAGNLNNFLKHNDDFDYFVVLDSDEVIPADFISQSLKYFQFDEKIGALQAYHLNKKGKNLFQYLMSISVNAQSLDHHYMRQLYGENSLLGHGMIIRKDVYRQTNGFPQILVEDTSMSAEIKSIGYDIVYAPNIVCYEDFPNDYIALKKRQCRWTAGNVQYIKKYAKKNRKSKYRWFERIDLILNHYSLPLIPVFALLFLINFLIIGFLGFTVSTKELTFAIIWMVFLLGSLLLSAINLAKSKNILLALPVFILTTIVYTAMNTSFVLSVFNGLLNKKIKFIVTPKESVKIPFKYIIIHSIVPFLFGAATLVLTYFSWGTVVPTLIVSIPCLLFPFAMTFSNISMTKRVANKSKRQI
ncbi:glycosyltransferase family 2 protein [Mycoplasma bovis]|nr:glycosyltransferase family 2 protein [Mycoplasmopsis bovis]